MLGYILPALILAIERLTEILKKYFTISPIYLSMIIGFLLGIPCGLVLPELGIFFAGLAIPWLLSIGAAMGLLCSLPANILHDVWQIFKDIPINQEIKDLYGKILEAKEQEKK